MIAPTNLSYKANQQEHMCSELNSRCLCEQGFCKRIACLISRSRAVAISNCRSSAAVKRTQLLRPNAFFQCFKDPSSHKRVRLCQKVLQNSCFGVMVLQLSRTRTSSQSQSSASFVARSSCLEESCFLSLEGVAWSAICYRVIRGEKDGLVSAGAWIESQIQSKADFLAWSRRTSNSVHFGSLMVIVSIKGAELTRPLTPGN